jgi:hypothetical protein
MFWSANYHVGRVQTSRLSIINGNVTALQSGLEQEMVAEVVSSFAQKLKAVVAPAEASQPWLSCGTSGCP